MKVLCIGVTLIGFSAQAAGISDWVQAAQEAARPDYSAIVTGDTQKAVIPSDAMGNTNDLSQLKGEDGMGEIKTPGLTEATRCLADSTDPKCLAVQLVYDGAANPPTLTDADKDSILNDYKDVIENVDKIAGDASDWVSSAKPSPRSFRVARSWKFVKWAPFPKPERAKPAGIWSLPPVIFTVATFLRVHLQPARSNAKPSRITSRFINACIRPKCGKTKPARYRLRFPFTKPTPIRVGC